MEHYDSDYAASATNGVSRVFANGVKYASLLTGVYAVCKDETDLRLAIISGTVYFIADVVREALREKADARRISILEQKLKE